MLLAFDTATPAVTVALHDGERTVASRIVVDARRHGELLAVGITAVLDEAWVPRQDVTAIAVGVGPGPFTGLRVGLVTARTLGLALDVPVYGVCTLDVLAAEHAARGESDRFLVASDARRREVYWASYDGDGTRLDGPHVDRPSELPASLVAELAGGLVVVGEGPRLHPEAFPHAAGPELPDARVLAEVVTHERAELLDPEPLYLRRPDIAAPSRSKPVS